MENKLRKEKVNFLKEIENSTCESKVFNKILNKITKSNEKYKFKKPDKENGGYASKIENFYSENGKSFFIKKTDKYSARAQKIVNFLEGNSNNLYFLKNLSKETDFENNYIQISKDKGKTIHRLKHIEKSNLYFTNELIAEIFLISMMYLADIAERNIIQTEDGKQKIIDVLPMYDEWSKEYIKIQENFKNKKYKGNCEILEYCKNLFDENEIKKIEEIFIKMLNNFLDNIELSNSNIERMTLLFYYLKNNENASDFLKDIKENYKEEWNKIEQKINNKREFINYWYKEWYKEVKKKDLFMIPLLLTFDKKFELFIIQDKITITQPETIAVIYNSNQKDANGNDIIDSNNKININNKTLDLNNIINNFDSKQIKQLLNNLRLYVNKTDIKTKNKNTYFPFVDFINKHYNKIRDKISLDELKEIVSNKIISKYNDNPIKMNLDDLTKIIKSKINIKELINDNNKKYELSNSIFQNKINNNQNNNIKRNILSAIGDNDINVKRKKLKHSKFYNNHNNYNNTNVKRLKLKNNVILDNLLGM